jgi:hypothetical protein
MNDDAILLDYFAKEVIRSSFMIKQARHTPSVSKNETAWMKLVSGNSSYLYD